jgi:tetratricopeptide (TPR) repeat protein
MAAIDLELAGRYDEAIAAFDAIRLAQQDTPENANSVFYHMALCNQQRGRFGIAVSLYEQGLAGRFNQEGRRGQLLGNLAKARTNQFLDSPPPAPEQIPAEGGNPEAYAGGGITERVPVHAGDTGETASLFKGKLAHAMSSWLPPVSDGDQIDADTVTTIRQFQRACGLAQTGEGDAQTWHALDTFTPRDIPNTVVSRFGERYVATANVEAIDVAMSIPLWEQLVSDGREAGLVENAKFYEFRLGRAHHRLSQFEQALIHYEAYLKRVIPDPSLLRHVFESIRLAREGRPAPKG